MRGEGGTGGDKIELAFLSSFLSCRFCKWYCFAEETKKERGFSGGRGTAIAWNNSDRRKGKAGRRRRRQKKKRRKDREKKRRRRTSTLSLSSPSSRLFFFCPQSNAEGPCALPLLFLSPLGGEEPPGPSFCESKLPRPASSSMPASAMIEAQVPTFSLEPWASRRRPVLQSESEKRGRRRRRVRWGKNRGKWSSEGGRKKRK